MYFSYSTSLPVLLILLRFCIIAGMHAHVPLTLHLLISVYFLLSTNISSRFIDVRVHAEPSPMPAPSPAKPLRAPDAPVRANTTPMRPPKTKPA
jgi:hypothetical protein